MSIRVRVGDRESAFGDAEALRQALASGRLSADAQVWDPLAEAWLPVRQVLAPTSIDTPAAATPPGAWPVQGVAAAQAAAMAAWRPRRRTWLWVAIAGGTVLGAVMALTVVLIASGGGGGALGAQVAKDAGAVTPGIERAPTGGLPAGSEGEPPASYPRDPAPSEGTDWQAEERAQCLYIATSAAAADLVNSCVTQLGLSMECCIRTAIEECVCSLRGFSAAPCPATRRSDWPPGCPPM